MLQMSTMQKSGSFSALSKASEKVNRTRCSTLRLPYSKAHAISSHYAALMESLFFYNDPLRETFSPVTTNWEKWRSHENPLVPTHLLQGTRIKLSFQTSVESVMPDKTAWEACVTKLSFTREYFLLRCSWSSHLSSCLTLKSLSSCQTLLFLLFF